MNPIIAMLKEHNVSDEKVRELFQAFMENPMMAMAGKITIAEVEELVPAGSLDPNEIHTPGIFVQRIIKGERFEKRIEQRTTRTK